MAIDTREKRASAVAVGAYFLGPSVTPNASKDKEWRQQAGYGYSGIAAGVVVLAVGIVSIVQTELKSAISLTSECATITMTEEKSSIVMS